VEKDTLRAGEPRWNNYRAGLTSGTESEQVCCLKDMGLSSEKEDWWSQIKGVKRLTALVQPLKKSAVNHTCIMGIDHSGWTSFESCAFRWPLSLYVGRVISGSAPSALKTEQIVVMSSNETWVFEQTVDASGSRKWKLERLSFCITLDDGTWKALPCIRMALLPLPWFMHYSSNPGVERVHFPIHWLRWHSAPSNCGCSVVV
jgi:hypothetical protein